MDHFDYKIQDASPTCSTRYIWPALARLIASRRWRDDATAIDLGCGNGATCDLLARHGFKTTGIDASATGIAHASSAYPGISFAVETRTTILRSATGSSISS